MLTYLTDALTAFDQAIDDNHQIYQPEFSSACRTLGNILQGMGRFEEAAVWSSRALESEPDLFTIYANLGSLYLKQQQWHKAIKTYEQIIDLQPDFAQAYWYLAQLYAHVGSRKEELATWERTFTLAPNKATADRYFRLGNAFRDQGNSEKALSCYYKAIELDAKFFKSYRNLGEILIAQRRWDEAIACYHQALDQDPNQAWAYHQLGSVRLEQGEFESAIAALRQAIRLDPGYSWSYHGLVRAFLQQRKWQEAIDTCHSILAEVGEYPWVYTQLANAAVKIGNEAEAISSYQKACVLRDWSLCAENNYHFTIDSLTSYLQIWEQLLQPLANFDQLNALEISCFQGMAACWLLDKILTHETAKLTCVDQNFTTRFAENIAKTNNAQKVSQLQGDIPQLLSSLPSNYYHLIKIEDKQKKADNFEQYAQLAWQLLKEGGIMICKSYRWINSRNPDQEPKVGIDAFLQSVPDQFEILHQNYHLIIKKVIT